VLLQVRGGGCATNFGWCAADALRGGLSLKPTCACGSLQSAAIQMAHWEQRTLHCVDSVKLLSSRQAASSVLHGCSSHTVWAIVLTACGCSPPPRLLCTPSAGCNVHQLLAHTRLAGLSNASTRLCTCSKSSQHLSWGGPYYNATAAPGTLPPDPGEQHLESVEATVMNGPLSFPAPNTIYCAPIRAQRSDGTPCHATPGLI